MVDIVAHRGLHDTAPENSLAAVKSAVAAGVRLIEVDARSTRSNDLRVLHDATVDRTTNGSGRLSALPDSLVEQLQLRDGSHLPRIAEVLDACLGHAVLCVDVKEVAAGRAVIDLVQQRRNYAVEIWSSAEEVVAWAADARIRSALITLGIMPRGGVRALLERARQLGAYAVSFFPADLDDSAIAACNSAGMPFMCGTPNDAETWTRLQDAGARAIITDFPLECATALRPPSAVSA